MKILAIRLKNLASLAGEQVIDFTAEPLASAGLFAITGPTGAGKSTILDALCGAVRQHATARQRLTAEQGSRRRNRDRRWRRAQPAAPRLRQRLRRSGFRRRRRPPLPRALGSQTRPRKVDGRLQASSQSLTDLTAARPPPAVKARVQGFAGSAPGADPGPVHRAVLLAQSEFSAFLKADDNERGTLLEKLTDTGLYSRLGQAAFEAAKEAKEGLARLEQQAGGLQPLEPEQRDELEREHQAQLDELKALQQQLKALEAQRQWLSELQRLENEREAACQQLQDAEDERENLAEARRILDLFEQLAPQRHRFLRLQDLGPLLDKAADSGAPAA